MSNVYSSITVGELSDKLQNEPITILDVQDKVDFDSNHIPGAINLPIGEFVSEAENLTKEKTYYVISKAGVRATRACYYLASLEYDVVYVQGGMNAWQSTEG
ncbi:rhodanese-like domain-containing protein [Tetragenococcus koreensis]|uniref:rhodanese-like domain-containing protein n=1 Tax=Tetragenococcus koreensis TaxID=290335 RepID=UPI001F42434E|nr:rhodanese-like domain-containing protein [Tetragenococcus koreensis]MCF1586079.1 rhodanese-like domain-containing protein [Tetragenococcus koreensis]MCF1615676.1 rhodanese-like domain-containing protein [Tetragenococcus koreensis]MCF1620444.1 rhodanese-like domain-containing protein [Tetragenococcus koreensis]MCF1625473.1 rhodanese-like domain-containing protein [Tetragenococcus koreensis]MCF1630362.1 rhodanese-like domain-containing protein [Tetragenococcus koreensis]